MKKHLQTLTYLLIVVLTIFVSACKDDSEVIVTGNTPNGNGGDTDQKVKITLTGQVVDEKSGFPVDSATIQILGTPIQNFIRTTDADGRYRAEFETLNNVDISLITYRVGYRPDTTAYTVNRATTNHTIPTISLEPIVTSVNESGPAASIFLLSASPNSINVRESGGIESTVITFQVLDSLGFPINIINQDTVTFKLASSIGGEFLYPSYGLTDNEGKVQVSLTSGTVAGVVQVYAELNGRKGRISSRPVFVSVHGGLPDLAHFSLGPKRFNFPAWGIINKTLEISVLIGDKYANPVKPNTAVYFTTTGGVIDGSVLTSATGTGTTLLHSGNPLPTHPTFGAGFAEVTARTSDENLNPISRYTIILFSGVPYIIASPMSFNIPNGGSQYFEFEVKDENGNPMCADTKISVTLEAEGAKVQGDVDVTLPDTQSKGWTKFGFVVFDNDTTRKVKPATVKIKSEGENGKAILNISGTIE